MDTQQQIEAFFLDHNDPYFEMIQNAESETIALDIALVELQKISSNVDRSVVLAAVQRIRSFE